MITAALASLPAADPQSKRSARLPPAVLTEVPMRRIGLVLTLILTLDGALHALRTWLDSWSGIGHVTVGMAHQGYDLQLTRYDERGWRATFYTTGMEHSPTSATGTGWERTPWHATQRAAWEALRQASREG